MAIKIGLRNMDIMNIMKAQLYKYRFLLFVFLLVFSNSCKSELDNYTGPQGGISGVIYDKITGEPIPLPTEGSGGALVSLFELNTNATATIDFRARQDGSYKNTKIFNGDYLVRVNGPFIGICEDYTTINGQTTLDLYAVPLSRIQISGEITTGNLLKVNYEVEKVGDATHQIKDIELIWNYAPGVDINSANYSTKVSVGTNLSGNYELDLNSDLRFIENHYKIKNNKNKIYVRVAATVEVVRSNTILSTAVNYSKVLELTVNEI